LAQGDWLKCRDVLAAERVDTAIGSLVLAQA